MQTNMKQYVIDNLKKIIRYLWYFTASVIIYIAVAIVVVVLLIVFMVVFFRIRKKQVRRKV
jgi:ABC-type multidrug transport system permease subunit